MKKCRYCHCDNQDSATVCSECGKRLDVLPTPNPAGDLKDPAMDPVIVGMFENTEHAGVLKAELEAAGIEAWTPEDYSVEFPLQTVSVQVAAKDAEAAREIAAEFFKSRAEQDSDEPDTKGAAKTKEAPEAAAATGTVPGRRACVSCGAAIPYDAVLCPKCGWTQPQLV